jgi:hypothetical protein
MGAPPPVKVVADWLLTPVDDPEPPVVEVVGLFVAPGDDPRLKTLELDPVGLEAPGPGDPIPEDPVGELPLTVAFPCPGETIEAAEPSPPELPGSPESGWPKKPLTVVFASF